MKKLTILILALICANVLLAVNETFYNGQISRTGLG